MDGGAVDKNQYINKLLCLPYIIDAWMVGPLININITTHYYVYSTSLMHEAVAKYQYNNTPLCLPYIIDAWMVRPLININIITHYRISLMHGWWGR